MTQEERQKRHKPIQLVDIKNPKPPQPIKLIMVLKINISGLHASIFELLCKDKNGCGVSVKQREFAIRKKDS